MAHPSVKDHARTSAKSSPWKLGRVRTRGSKSGLWVPLSTRFRYLKVQPGNIPPIPIVEHLTGTWAVRYTEPSSSYGCH
ncbi:hypothetical protein M404DRAFT_1001548 [Pisolithus tinctorius Marx 270]|uniref:Uncharacterized protein n=1 Tax=Pisolithus tinctorius Marx 270 TaxID=870435 RepID=A0A0C3P783_PISTI|nr:hypothetical protein M404DRAFT_1001548 [Pisolithus tinctorius Marx 270]